MSTTINLVGAKGGVGTTTIAVALAKILGGTAISTHAPTDLTAIAGQSESTIVTFGDGPIVIDHGTSVDNEIDGPLYIVLRGPDYLGLRRALKAKERSLARGAIVLTEEGRSLGPSDVEAVLNIPVVAVVPVDPAVARAVDAGILTARLPASLSTALNTINEGAPA